MSEGLHDGWEFENRVNRLRSELEEVPRLLGEVSEVMLSVARSSLSMAPGGSRSAPLPGGRALVVLGPVSDHASEPDDLPHPVTVLREIADAVRRWMARPSVASESMSSALGFVSESARWVVTHEELAVWVEHRLADVLGLLRSLVGDVERSEPRTFEPEELRGHMRARLLEEPKAWRMTPAEADHFWPGISVRVKAHRSRARARARAESAHLSAEAVRASGDAGVRVDVEPEFFAEPDAAGRYSADDLATFHQSRGHVRTGTRRVADDACAEGEAV